MKKLALLAVTIGLGAGALFVSSDSQAADHLDAPAVMTQPMADIADVYVWMTSDGTKVNLAMTISPADPNPETRMFGPTIQYVFHVTSYPGFGMAGTETKVICTFTNDNAAQCWITAGTLPKAYVTGDPSVTAGIASSDGKVRLFAGQRSDPFFFNLGGFKTVVGAVEANAGALTFNAAGCPAVPPTGAVSTATLRGVLQAAPAAAIGICPANQLDCFASLNVKAIVLQVDKTLLNVGSNTLLSVWGSTHATPQ